MEYPQITQITFWGSDGAEVHAKIGTNADFCQKFASLFFSLLLFEEKKKPCR